METRSGFTDPSHFARVPDGLLQRSRFPRENMVTSTLEPQVVVPLFWDEVLPGDTWDLTVDWLIRYNTLIAPSMVNTWADCHIFFVPYRLVWVHWQNFLGAQDNPSDSVDYVVPTVELSEVSSVPIESLWDYLDLPAGTIDYSGSSIKISALAFRAYNLIWNQWYRDQNLQDSVTVETGDGPDDPTSNNYLASPLPRALTHDYFTSCLPWPQKGDAVTIPIGTSAPVIGDGYATTLLGGYPNANRMLIDFNLGVGLGYTRGLGYADRPLSAVPAGTANTGATWETEDYNSDASYSLGLTTDPTKSHIFADLSGATAVTINSLRQAITMQQILEANARGGTRYIEILQMQFGTSPTDARLQRPEYIGGASSYVTISPVPQTSQTDTTPQANLSSYGAGRGRASCHYTADEHGMIFVMISTRVQNTYQNQVNRKWTRSTVWDFYRPQFANLGEQAVLNSELCFSGTDADDSAVFGYQERWAEYRFRPSIVSGYMRTSDYSTDGLDAWTVAFDFDTTAPSLATLIATVPPINRIIAVSEADGPVFRVDSRFGALCTRIMPVYSVPGLLRL